MRAIHPAIRPRIQWSVYVSTVHIYGQTFAPAFHCPYVEQELSLLMSDTLLLHWHATRRQGVWAWRLKRRFKIIVCIRFWAVTLAQKQTHR